MAAQARLPRSYLYVPGNAPDKMPKAWAGAADAVILDLEDAVPINGKAQARETVRTWLDTLPPAGAEGRSGREMWVRVNPGKLGLEDVEALAGCAAVDGLVLAKAAVDDVAAMAGVLDGRGAPWMLSPLLETPEAVFGVRSIAAQPRVRRIQLGEYDLCAEVGVTPGPDEQETAWSRSVVVMASAEAGLDPPVAPVSVVIRETEILMRSTRRAQAQGFVGRACIHPAQVDVVHQVFTPDEDAVRAATEMVELFERAEADGRSVVVDEAGRLVDLATVRSARRTLALARAGVGPVD